MKFSLAANQTSSKAQGALIDYVAIMRLDHSTKHIFIIPGMILAALLRGVQTESLLVSAVVGFAAAVCVASANYVINEWLDRESDRHHPTKSGRVAVQKELDGRIVTAQWFVLLSVGIALALTSSHAMAVVCAFFGLQGIVYNVQPVRSKDLAFLDVISESVNNAFRLCLGWLMVDSTTLPPGSIVVAFWCGGAFLMAAKRLSEYRQLSVSHGRDVLARYRVSFASYSEPSLAVSCLVYAMLSAVLLAIFLIKYRIEYICLMPGIIALFAFYYFIAMKSDSSAQKPERLFQEPWLMAAVVVVSLLFVVTTVLEIPVLRQFTEQQYISIR